MESASTESQALQMAVAAFGSQSKMARHLGVTQGAVSKWIASGKKLPDIHVLKVEAETGISRHELRPDLYPYESANDARRPSHGFGDLEPAR